MKIVSLSQTPPALAYISQENLFLLMVGIIIVSMLFNVVAFRYLVTRILDSEKRVKNYVLKRTRNI